MTVAEAGTWEDGVWRWNVEDMQNFRIDGEEGLAEELMLLVQDSVLMH